MDKIRLKRNVFFKKRKHHKDIKEETRNQVTNAKKNKIKIKKSRLDEKKNEKKGRKLT